MGAIVRIKFGKNAFEVILNRVCRNVNMPAPLTYKY
jgi:hypothetical protein